MFKTLQKLSGTYRIQVLPIYGEGDKLSLNIVLAPITEGGLIPPVIRVEGTVDEVDATWKDAIVKAVDRVAAASAEVDTFMAELDAAKAKKIEEAKKSAGTAATPASAKKDEPKKAKAEKKEKAKDEDDEADDEAPAASPATTTTTPAALTPAWKKKDTAPQPESKAEAKTEECPLPPTEDEALDFLNP